MNIQVDGHDVPGVLDRSWHVARAQTGSPTAVQGGPSVADGHLGVDFSARSSASYAGISPDDLPAVVPVLLGRLAKPYRTLTTGSSGTFPVQSVGRAESTPFRGPSGVVMDFDAFIRSALQTNSDTQVFVWARADTPQSILDRHRSKVSRLFVCTLAASPYSVALARATAASASGAS